MNELNKIDDNTFKINNFHSIEVVRSIFLGILSNTACVGVEEEDLYRAEFYKSEFILGYILMNYGSGITQYYLIDFNS
jgi:hypothetical protein